MDPQSDTTTGSFLYGVDSAAGSEMTADAFEALPEPAAGCHYELIDGKVSAMTPPGFEHGEFQADLTTALRTWLRTNPIGRVVTELAVRLADDLVLVPDIAVVLNAHLPSGADRHRPLDGPPDLAIEVVSPGDSFAEVEARVDRYLAHGVPAVWVVGPGARRPYVYRAGHRGPTVLAETDTLDGGEVLPGFVATVRDLFPEPPPA